MTTFNCKTLVFIYGAYQHVWNIDDTVPDNKIRANYKIRDIDDGIFVGLTGIRIESGHVKYTLRPDINPDTAQDILDACQILIQKRPNAL